MHRRKVAEKRFKWTEAFKNNILEVIAGKSPDPIIHETLVTTPEGVKQKIALWDFLTYELHRTSLWGKPYYETQDQELFLARGPVS